ncbi:glycosyltransferase family 2 protein [Nesterenkonia rhizosphaerae]|uniref:Glycosyltransferase family 2 protein n=1 Tax=Nesterenkonia rhizosphaerae TaxID=1348272 RepID=A0ABP9FWP1_9MICC
MKTLSLIVPSYNSAEYLPRCLDTLLPADGIDDVEVIVVNDGSTDSTREVAEAYAEAHPDVVRVVSQPNGGHGSAINTGLDHALGHYVRVVDSDDWLNAEAFTTLRQELRRIIEQNRGIDLVLSNYVYENEAASRTKTIRYTRVLPVGEDIGWDDVGSFGPAQYLLMHALTYRTQLLREVQLRLPEHTFYVDNLFAYIPLPQVRSMHYLDVDLYRYYIGRPDQSVNEKVMISRLDQQLLVNRMMVRHLAQVRASQTLHPALNRYMAHYLGIITVVTSTMALRGGSKEMLRLKADLWDELRRVEPQLYRRLRLSLLGMLVNLPGQLGRRFSLGAYRTARWAYGFN